MFHQSSPAAYDQRLKYISGFSGSYGYAWVLGPAGGDRQALWSDGRYYLQADQQLDCDWIIMQDGYPSAEEWLLDVLPPNATVGIDPRLVSISKFRRRRQLLEQSRTVSSYSFS